ncbi:glycosyltransferase family 90 protein [Phanerochaete carnosa HHB-10118-sp]|uniref:Glycosyltransferase family 90 protein n=1 Tax=Phanerochaete carnosa (strain HHB-10118-sp) TaxID=650164 RepID=K5VYH4_PHACS|nr:glycosyltransferase family 90 protein [Phanerochaete carnosa HHB-10118-sp]EKM56638.1 glycosyltransferase family 90 protein [Phanerochaete carnosa HHB-10118-sp]
MHDGIPSSKRGFFYVAAVLLIFMQAGLWSARRRTQEVFPDNSLVPKVPSLFSLIKGESRTTIKEHPIPRLMAEAEVQFRERLTRQSKTLVKAVAEYKTRFKRDPPKGFDDWWKFVQDNDVLMVDEYNAVAEDLEPFWDLSPAEFRQRASLAGHLPSVDLVKVRGGEGKAVNVKDGFDSPDGVSERAKGFLLMIEKFQDKLPDLDFPINAMAEGRILVPWEHRQYPNLTDGGVAEQLSGRYSPDWRGEGTVWEAFRRTCEPKTPARRLFSSTRASSTTQARLSQLDAIDDEVTFVRSVQGNFSFCQNPWAHYSQGHFFSDWRTIPVLFPIFSPAKASGFLDIRVPSHYYHGQTRRYTYGWDPVNLERHHVDHMEMPWELKSDKVFWRGASTGGGSSPPGFAGQYQRHRLVQMASDLSMTNRTILFADPPGSTTYTFTEVPTAVLNREVMDVAFVKLVGSFNFPGGPDALLRDHRFDEGGVNLGDHWKHKYLVDIDGMGYSGRFLSFLESDSAVLKATVYREFFEEWIQPWLHYIPLSPTYHEIYNIHAFFSGGTDSTLHAANSTALQLPAAQRRSLHGDRRLRRIARAGKQWKRTLGRRVDMEAYVYRLCLEYARLWSDDRDSMNFTL